MKKLRLDPDLLRVESFPTAAPDGIAGTVHAHATPVTMCGATCSPTCNTNCDCTYIICTRGLTYCTIP